MRLIATNIIIILLLSACAKSDEAKDGNSDTLGFPVVTEPKMEVGGSSDGIATLSFRPNGKEILAAGFDKTINLYSVETGALEKQFEGHDSFVSSITINGTGDSVYSSSFDKTLRKWSIDEGTESKKASFSGAVEDVAISSDGKSIATAHVDGFIRIWDSDLVEEKLTIELPEDPLYKDQIEAAYKVLFSHDGQFLFSGNGNSIVLWDAESGKKIRAFEPDSSDYRYGKFSIWFIQAIALSSDGKYIAAATGREKVFIWEVETGDQKFVVGQMHDIEKGIYDTYWSSIEDLLFSPDGSKIVVGISDMIRVWDINTKEEVYRYKTKDFESLIGSFALSPDKKSLADAGGTGNAIRIWDVTELFSEEEETED